MASKKKIRHILKGAAKANSSPRDNHLPPDDDFDDEDDWEDFDVR